MTLLRLPALSAAAIIGLAACQTTTTISTTAVATAAPARTQSAAFVDLMNSERTRAGLGPVRANPQLASAARSHAADMSRNGYFSHTGLNGSTLMRRAMAAGYCRTGVAENIASGQRSEAAVYESWLNSSGHRRNMLRRTATDYGLAQVGGKWVLLVGDGC